MKEKYESLSLAVLKDLAKARGMKGISGMKKAELVEAMLAQDEEDKKAAKGKTAAPKKEKTETQTRKSRGKAESEAQAGRGKAESEAQASRGKAESEAQAGRP